MAIKIDLLSAEWGRGLGGAERQWRSPSADRAEGETRAPIASVGRNSPRQGARHRDGV